jgi:GDPmannose 4,6-dehydratase
LSRALITGVTGQDGSFLAELLLEKGYAVTGLVRGEGPAVDGNGRAGRTLGCSEHLRERMEVVQADLMDPESVRGAIEQCGPGEIYHLASPSFVPESWEHSARTVTAIVGLTGAVLDALRAVSPGPRLFVAGTSAMFGEAPYSPQREDTPCHPTNPYAIAKLAVFHLVDAMRSHYDLFACTAIMFNHESERRPERFVTRKISRAVAEIYLGMRKELVLGDLQAIRDWSFAGDIVRGAWMMLQRERPEDFILGSGTPHTVEDFAKTAFACLGLDFEQYLRIDPTLVRKPEGTPNVADPSRARSELGWEPELSFEQLVERMVKADLAALRERAGQT